MKINKRITEIIYQIHLREKDPITSQIALFDYYDKLMKRGNKIKLIELLTLMELLDRIKPTREVRDYWLKKFDIFEIENKNL